MKIVKIVTVVVCLLAALIGASPALAQNDVGTIAGFVTDQSGAVVPNAKVTIINEGTSEERSVTSDGQGHFAVTNLPPAVYTLTAEASGFQKFVSSSNTLASNSTISIDAKLAVGSATQSVEVTASAAILQTQSPSVQSEITGAQVQKEELNGRNPIYQTQLLPGANSTATLGDFNFAFNSGDTFRINGARTQDTEYWLDGAPAVRTRDDGEIIAGASVDSVQEIQVLTADYSAEYGSASGAQVRIVTKSGTKQFHGALYEYARNAAFNANTWTRNLSPTTRFASPFVYNNFGFAVGGPVDVPKLKDRFFFFVSEDWIRYRFAATETLSVPSALMRQGNFSELLGPNPWYPAGTKIYEPGTCPKVGAPTCIAFMGNIIPPSFRSANGMAILDAFPAPTPGFSNGASNNIGAAGDPENQRKGQINGDFLLNASNHLEFRRSDDSYYQLSPFNQTNPLVPITFNRPNQTVALGWVWTISPSMVNEARFSFSIDDVYILAYPSGAGYNRGQFGINFPYILPGAKAEENKIPTATIPNFSTLAGGPYPSHSSGIIYAGSDSLTKVAGNHTIKGGFFFDDAGENDNDQINVQTVPGGASNQNGTFIFTDARTGYGATSGVGLANLALGLADSYTEIGPKAYTLWRGKMFEYFIQDNWQITPKFNLDYGVRETTVLPPYAQWANADYFDPASYNPATAPTVSPTTGNITLGTGNPYDGVVIPGFVTFPSSANGRVPAANPANDECDGSPCNGLFAAGMRKGYVATTNQFQPRLGFAYQLFNGTVLRAGAGRFVTNKGIIDNIFPGGNSPFQPTVTVNNVSVDNPGASLTPGIEPALQITTMNRGLVPPSRWNWNVTVQRQIVPLQSVFSIAYVGARGLHNWDVFDINQPTVGALTANPGVAVNYLRPYKGFSAIQQAQSGVSSTYNGLQLAWNTHVRSGSTLGVAYTFSKSMDNSSNYRDIVPDTYYTKNLWGPSEYDIRHVLIINYLYELPFLKGRSDLIGSVLGGWSFSGNTQFQTGQPCGIGTNSTDYAGVGEQGSFGCGSEGQFWVMNGTPSLIKGWAGSSGSGPSWFSTTTPSGSPLFTAPPLGTFNLQPGVRDSVYQPGLQNWNISMSKTFTLPKEKAFEFRAEAYNFINHPNLAGPNLNPTSSLFGKVTSKSTSNPRTLQLGARLEF